MMVALQNLCAALSLALFIAGVLALSHAAMPVAKADRMEVTR